MSAGDIDPAGVQILSTEGMIRRPSRSDAEEFIVATEVGILYRLRKAYPDQRFLAADDRASCQYMKVTTLPKVLRSLQRDAASHHGATEIAQRARLAIERMVSIGGAAPAQNAPASLVGE